MADVVDLALRNNPTTQESWQTARAAAMALGSARGEYYPTINGSVDVTRLQTVPSQGRAAVTQTTYGPSATLSWLLLDFGGRAGRIGQAREALFAADFTHNATIQNVVLQVESAYFDYMATKSLVRSDSASLREAQASLQATQERHRVGLATVADVLQAQTAVSQAQLALETNEGTLQTTRGALAVSMGLPANLPYDVEARPPAQVGLATDSVNALIQSALAARPDLAAAQAEFAQARERVRELRADRLPSIVASGTGGRTYIPQRLPNGGNNYNITLGLQIPLFNGFSREYNQRQAEALAQAALARASALRQQVVFQVFSSYYALQTAARRVRTADDLLASAQQSAEVALGRYRAGVGSIIDLLTAQTALASARAQQVQARWVWETSLAQLAHDAGALDTHGQTTIRVTPDSTRQIPPQ
jgi:outer membrane protein TolC